MMSLTVGLFTQVSGSGPLGPLVGNFMASMTVLQLILHGKKAETFCFISWSL